MLLCVAALAVCARASASELDVSSPSATIESLHSGLAELAAHRPNATVLERYTALEPLIAATHDLPYIAEFALRRQWPSLGAADRERFIAAFERLSVTTYASRFKQVGPSTFEMRGESPIQDGRVQVTTAVARADGSAVTLEYLLQRRDDGWKIINIVADGVSDLALKRAEYQRVLSGGTLDDLIGELAKQTERLQ
jgi:phospholipid transport system substrate-binding protein